MYVPQLNTQNGELFLTGQARACKRVTAAAAAMQQLFIQRYRPMP